MEEHMRSRLTYTVPEVAELLGISRSSAYECVRRGEIPALTLGRRVVIAKATIDTMLNVAAHELEAGVAAP
jgi:excisionase family DNA binding protein